MKICTSAVTRAYRQRYARVRARGRQHRGADAHLAASPRSARARGCTARRRGAAIKRVDTKIGGSSAYKRARARGARQNIAFARKISKRRDVGSNSARGKTACVRAAAARHGQFGSVHHIGAALARKNKRKIS